MSTEVKAWRAKLYTALGTVTGLSAKIGTRIFPVWPALKVQYPCMAYNLAARKSLFDTGMPAWSGVLELYLFSPSEDALDDIETLLVEWANDKSGTLLTTLTDSTVKTTMFLFEEVEQNPGDAFETENFLVIVRTLRFGVSFVKKSAAWPA